MLYIYTLVASTDLHVGSLVYVFSAILLLYQEDCHDKLVGLPQPELHVAITIWVE